MKLRPEGGEIVTILIIVLVVGGLIFGGYKLVGVGADWIAERIPDQLEAELFGKLGDQASWSSEATSKDRKRAHAIFEKLKAAPGHRDLPYKLRFLTDENPNAFAMPGGTLGVTDGLLSLVKSDIGLATVIGHEFGHMQKRHSLKMLGRSLIVATALMFVVGDTGFLMGMALDMAEKSHSRAQEDEADDFGLRLVHKVYGTTDGSLEFFEKISEETKGGDGKLLAMLSTHPYTPDRIAHLKALAKELDEQSP